MERKKSKNIFWVFSILAVVFLVLFSFAVGASNASMMILTFILLVVTFGTGSTIKKKHRENDRLQVIPAITRVDLRPHMFMTNIQLVLYWYVSLLFKV